MRAHALFLIVSLLALPVLCGLEPAAPQPACRNKAGNATESTTKERPTPSNAQSKDKKGRGDITTTRQTQLPSDIRSLTQHFNRPGGEIEPWVFVPESNIAELSTAEHPGVATTACAMR